MMSRSSFGNFVFKILWKSRNLTIVMLIFFPSEVFLHGDSCYVTLDKYQEVIAVVSDEFLSVSIDTNIIDKEEETLFANPRFRKLAVELAPARLRIGGKRTDTQFFSKDSYTEVECENFCPENYSNSVYSLIKSSCGTSLPLFILTAMKWEAINEFCKATKLKLLFSMNVLLRDERGWDDQNAIELLEYSRQKYTDIDWQLGNEPNSFRYVFNVSVSPQALAQDFKHFRKLLKNQYGYSNSLLIGPHISQPNALSYFDSFLSSGSDYINASSFHHYYLNSSIATLEDFWNPDTMDTLEKHLKAIGEYTVYKKPLWLSETGSSFSGGILGLSDSFAGNPLWVDKLGLAAKYNVTTVVRQCFYGARYSLLGSKFDPLPDRWISVLHKKLVGKHVLRVKHACSRFQRFYAHCANRKYTDDLSAVTIFALNLESTEARFLLNGTALDYISIDEFIITPFLNNRLSQTVLLNGKPLYFESSMPDLIPKVIENSEYILMPPYSIGFWVIRNTYIKACNAEENLYDNNEDFSDFWFDEDDIHDEL